MSFVNSLTFLGGAAGAVLSVQICSVFGVLAATACDRSNALDAACLVFSGCMGIGTLAGASLGILIGKTMDIAYNVLNS